MDLEALPRPLPSRCRALGLPSIHLGRCRKLPGRAQAWMASMVDTAVYQLKLQLQAPDTSVLGYIVMLAMEW